MDVSCNADGNAAAGNCIYILLVGKEWDNGVNEWII